MTKEQTMNDHYRAALLDKVKELAQVRAVLEEEKSLLDHLRLDLETTPEFQAVARQKEFVNAKMMQEATTKAELSELMIADPEETKWDFGQVINRKQINIVDEGAALAWALERKICIQLDTKAIKKVAEELNPDGVEISIEKATRISTDLSEYEPPKTS